jgi:hypothetical protein
MRPGPDNRWFFVHVMKAGGTTVQALFQRNHEARHLYPCHLDEPIFGAKMNPQRLAQLTPERLDEIYVFSGHLPVTTREHLPYPTRTMTTLREPVDRTVSWLRQNQRVHSPGATLEEIYDHAQARRAYADNHQTRMFAVRSSDRVESFTSFVEIDEQRFAEATARLDELDMVGFQDDLERFVATVADRFGYVERQVLAKNVASGDYRISKTLRRRIAEDNAYDLAFYEYACQTRGQG